MSCFRWHREKDCVVRKLDSSAEELYVEEVYVVADESGIHFLCGKR